MASSALNLNCDKSLWTIVSKLNGGYKMICVYVEGQVVDVLCTTMCIIVCTPAGKIIRCWLILYTVDNTNIFGIFFVLHCTRYIIS
jgi:hypothetical protein